LIIFFLRSHELVVMVLSLRWFNVFGGTPDQLPHFLVRFVLLSNPVDSSFHAHALVAGKVPTKSSRTRLNNNSSKQNK
jgi:hypothetical protein